MFANFLIPPKQIYLRSFLPFYYTLFYYFFQSFLSDLLTLAAASPEERGALGRFGRDAVCRHYSADLMAERTLAVYRRAFQRFRDGRQTDAVLCGYYGYGNCGDELILRHIVASQKARCGTVRLGVMTADGNAPEGTVGIRRYRMSEVLRALRHSGALILGGGSLLQDATSRLSHPLLVSTLLISASKSLPREGFSALPHLLISSYYLHSCCCCC